MGDLLTLPNAMAAVIGLSMTAYALLGGADFGGGVWDLLARGPRRDRQRELVADAIAPIWEANHVWLILVIVLLFTCFPLAFAQLSIALHIPLTLMLVGIVLRGSAFAFRSYGRQAAATGRRWGRIFSLASVVTPVLLGVTIGAIASGGLVRPDASSFAARFVEPWLTPFAFAVGALTLALFAFLAAVYLGFEAGDDELREDFRRRALGAAAAVLGTAILVLLLAEGAAPRIREALVGSAWAPALHALTATAAVAVVVALWRRRPGLARIAAALQVSLILWGWMLAQYPYLVPPDTTIEAAAAPRATLRLVAVGLAVGFAVLLPALYYLFRVFRKWASVP